jgi:hypothetical protein
VDIISPSVAEKKPRPPLSEEQKEKARARAKAWYWANRERAQSKCREYRAARIEEIREYDRKRPARKIRPESLAARRQVAKEYRERNKDRNRQRLNDWRKKNHDAIIRHKKTYYAKNKAAVIASTTARNGARLKTDREYKLRQALRSRLFNAIRGNFKNGSAVRDLGCTIKHLVDHVESQFLPGMTWETWGTAWHLDHFFPLAAANFDHRVEFLAVNNWRNLRPLAVEENVRKKDAVTPEAQALFDALVAEFSQQAVA